MYQFFPQISCLQVSILIIHRYCIRVSYPRAQLLSKNSSALTRTLDCFPKNFPKHANKKLENWEYHEAFNVSLASL